MHSVFLRGPHPLRMGDILRFLCHCFADPWGREAGEDKGRLKQGRACEFEAARLEESTCGGSCSAENHRAGFSFPARWNLAGLHEDHAGQHGLPGLFAAGTPDATLRVLQEIGRGNQISSWACVGSSTPRQESAAVRCWRAFALCSFCTRVHGVVLGVVTAGGGGASL